MTTTNPRPLTGAAARSEATRARDVLVAEARRITETGGSALVAGVLLEVAASRVCPICDGLNGAHVPNPEGLPCPDDVTAARLDVCDECGKLTDAERDAEGRLFDTVACREEYTDRVSQEAEERRAAGLYAYGADVRETPRAVRLGDVLTFRPDVVPAVKR